MIVDNGALAPAASDVRFGVGTNGKVLVADSSQATGLNYATITPNAAATSGDIAIFNGTSGTPTPLQDSKMLITSTGALQSAPTGGNARGTSAVDLQVVRVNPAQVASGNKSGVLSGENNTASATDSCVAGGIGNTASGASAFTGGGNNNQASQTNSAVGAGINNTASGTSSFVGAGRGNTANNTASSAVGGTNNTASGINATVSGGSTNTASGTNSSVPGGFDGNAYLQGQIAHSNGSFVAIGDAQESELIYRIATVDATAGVESFLDGAGVRAVIPNNTTWAFLIHTIARSSAGVCALWETKGAIQNNAGTVSLVAAVSQSVIADGTGATWGVTGNHVVSADNGNKSLKIAVTGAVATGIRWVSHARLVEVSF